MTARKQKGNKKTPANKSNAAKAASEQIGKLKKEENTDDIVDAAEKQEKDKTKEAEEAAKALTNANKKEAQTGQAPDDEFFKLNGKIKYWRNKVYIPDFGHVSGKVKTEHFKKFFALAPKDLKLENWLADSDLVEESIDKARKKMKARAKANKD